MINKNWDDKNHYAVKHIKYYTDTEDINKISPLGVRVAITLDIWKGIHNISNNSKKKADWYNDRMIKIFYYGGVANYDNQHLTRLFTIATLAGLRFSIHPCNFKNLYISFWMRNKREGRLYERMPHPLKQVEDILKLELKDYEDTNE